MAEVKTGTTYHTRNRILDFAGAVLQAGRMLGFNESEIASGAMYAALCLSISDPSFTDEMARDWVMKACKSVRLASAAGGSDAQA